MRNLLTEYWLRLRNAAVVFGWRLESLSLAAWTRLRAAVAGVRILIPIALIALLLAGYTWWWQEVADGLRTSVEQFQLDQHGLSREAQWDSIDISGFPYQVEAQITRPHITAPDRGVAWDGKAVAISIQPLAPGRISFSLEGHQHVLYVKNGQLIEGGIDANKALVKIVAGAYSARQIALELEGLSGQGEYNSQHVELVVQSASASADVEDGDPDAATAPIALTATLNNVAVRGDIALPLGPTITLVDLKAHLRYPSLAPDGGTPNVVSEWRRTNTPIHIERFKLDWGGVTVEARGDIKLDAETRPQGRLRLKIGNHRRLLEVLKAQGWISAEAEPNIDGALNTLAFISGDPERRIDVAVNFQDGFAYLELFGLLPIKVGPVNPLFPPPTLAMPG
ncbi:MAG: DUF2125 domain-containing protein [Alphaproteobacteria bacterium]|nr:DUF2125 domain-containing protein [Alphaproteobacteria bacterium]